MKLRDRKYMCTRDLQGGDFAVGGIGNIEYWRERAMGWAYGDDSMELYYSLKYLPKKQVINFVTEFWELEFTEITEEFSKIYTMIEKMHFDYGFECKDQRKIDYGDGFNNAVQIILYNLVYEKE